MRVENYISYQGSKSNIIDFIVSGIHEYTEVGDTVLDIFAGSGAVSFALSDSYNIIANDVEPYSATINKAILGNHQILEDDIPIILKTASDYFEWLLEKESLSEYINIESRCLHQQDLPGILGLYSKYPTIWNTPSLTPTVLRDSGRFNLFTRYYGASYFGIKQAMEIDSLIYSIFDWDRDTDLLYSCLFYSMKETVFSKDGHMAQPLNFERFPKRGFDVRKKSVLGYFRKKLHDVIVNEPEFYGHNVVYNRDFKDLLEDDSIIKNVDLVYADPPYTDMQYSRYYHLLNVARLYDFPEPTITSRGFTTGLYTEGRYQSELSKKSKARENIRFLMKTCHAYNKNLALSYAYPKNTKVQATDRYTLSIEDLFSMAKGIFGSEHVKINQINHTHTNNKNSAGKPVIEYLILCGETRRVNLL